MMPTKMIILHQFSQLMFDFIYCSSILHYGTAVLHSVLYVDAGGDSRYTDVCTLFHL